MPSFGLTRRLQGIDMFRRLFKQISNFFKDDKKKLIYLASCYSSADKAVEHARYLQVKKKFAELSKQDYVIFSPIVLCHPAAVEFGLGTDYNYWKNHCEVTVSHCDELWVLMSQGWQESKGVRAEIEIAKKCGLKIKYIS